MSGGNRFIWPNFFSVDGSGVPRAGAMLWFYETGTTTLQDTYSDSGLTAPNRNPVVADSLGQFGNIFLLGSPDYKVVLQDSTGTQIWTADPVSFSVAADAQVPVGAMLPYGGATAPAGWLLCYGQAVSRTTYSALFAAIGTSYGSGDGSTTFNVPDLRGSVPVGQDNMGGSAANRVTSAGSGVNGSALGAAGGSQLTQLHAHTLTDPGHNHTLTDPQHQHVEQGMPSSGSAQGPIANGQGTSTPFTVAVTSKASTGITLASATTGLTMADYGSGGSQNMPPCQITTWIIYAGA